MTPVDEPAALKDLRRRFDLIAWPEKVTSPPHMLVEDAERVVAEWHREQTASLVARIAELEEAARAVVVGIDWAKPDGVMYPVAINRLADLARAADLSTTGEGPVDSVCM